MTGSRLRGKATTLAAASICVALLLSGCANQKIQQDTRQHNDATQVAALALDPRDFGRSGLAIITPSSVTGQEEDKQALALAFTEILRSTRPDLHVMSLPETLSAVNRAGMAADYKRMFEDYRVTGIFEREILRKVGAATGMRYLAQLKLSGFRQESKGRWGFLGIRLLETKTSTIRLYFQIWDSQDGSVVWEGSQESSSSYESLAEDYVPLKHVVEESARNLVARLPTSGPPASETDGQASGKVTEVGRLRAGISHGAESD